MCINFVLFNNIALTTKNMQYNFQINTLFKSSIVLVAKLTFLLH